ncbi:Hypotetical protein [Gulosibacter molinativorax]|nr:Hypotetical protein [Gulosibacter molinativorax]
MGTVTVLRSFANLTPQPWANGAGTTTEVVSFEDSASFSPAGTAPWRLSVASLEREGDFSPLPGAQRVFTPVGSSLELTVNGVAHEVADGSSLEFSGDDVVRLTRLDRPCHAVNLMARVDAGGHVPKIRFVGAPGQGADAGPDALAVLALGDQHGYEKFDLIDTSGRQDSRMDLSSAGFGVVTLA